MTTTDPGTNVNTCFRFQPALADAIDEYFRIDGDSTEGGFTSVVNGADTDFVATTWMGASYGVAAAAVATAAVSLLSF